MSIITPSDTALAYLQQLTIGQQRFDLSEQSDTTGHTATRLGGPPRWTVALRTLDALEPAVAALWKAIAVQMRGRVNHLAIHDVTMPAPRGTLRGSPVLSATAAAGATSLALSGCYPGVNLLRYPFQFDNAIWQKSTATVTPNTTVAPDGATTADTLRATGLSGVFQYKTVSPSTQYTFSWYAMRSADTAVAYRIYDDTNNVDIVASTSYYSSINASTWVRMSVTFTTPASCTAVRVYPCAFSTGGAHGVVAWGAQLELGATATELAGVATLLQGDWLQIGTGVGSHFCMVTADVSADEAGAMTVAIEPPLRKSFASSTAAIWDRPKCHLKQRPDSLSWSGAAGSSMVGGFAFDLMEDWSA